MKRTYRNIGRIAGNVISVSADRVGFGDLAVVSAPQGTSLAEVIRIDGSTVYLQVFSGTGGISTSDRVHFLGRPMDVPFSDDLLGRVFCGSGSPRDGGPALTAGVTTVAGSAVNPAGRIMPSRMIHTGIPMIDVFNSLVESQKISVFTTSREPHRDFLARMALQAEVDVIVLGGMGLRYEDYLYFCETLSAAGAMSRSALFVHTASEPVVECLMVPDLCLTVAEKFALSGRRVLVLLTDMTNFCDALKEIAIIMERVPSNRGYPGELYSELARRYEKAVDFEGRGSVTILSVTTMPGDDVTHPAPDNTGYITEGQYYLHGGRIEPFGSLSRLKQFVNKATRDDHRPLMDGMIRLYAYYQETLEKKAMGFKMGAWDEKFLKYGALFEKKLMDLSVSMPLNAALDTGWRILAECFEPVETGLRSEIIDKYWPKNIPKDANDNAPEPL